MKITDVKAIVLSSVVPEGKGMRSDAGKTLKWDAIVVRVETDEGITGHGPALGTPLAVKHIVEGRLKPGLVGEDPTRIEYLWEKMYSGTRLSISLNKGYSVAAAGMNPSGEVMCAISGVDVALWDIAGRALGVPVYKLLGGLVRDRIPAYASGGWALGEAAGDEVAGYVARGYRAVKMHVGAQDGSFNDSMVRVRAMRRAVGADVDIMLDSHGSLTVAEAIRLAKAVEEHDIKWLEEPVSSSDRKGTAEVRAASSTPIAGGEREYSRYGIRELIEARALDYLQPDVAVCGGITEMRRVCAMGAAYNLPVAPHNWSQAGIFAANLQLAAATPNVPILEVCQAPHHELYWDITSPRFVVKDGWAYVPDGPGLGVGFDPDMERRFPYVPGPTQTAF